MGLPTFCDSIQRELLGVLLDERGEPPQEPRAVRRGHGTPGREGPLRSLDGGVCLLHARLIELGDRLLGRGIEDGERHGAARGATA